jgi:hypothetical protein
MNFNFGEVLTRAWQIVWKHKVLWLFGILASCNSNRGSFNFNNSMNYQEDANNLPPQVFEQINRMTENIVPIITILVAIICVIGIVTVFLGTMGRIGLVRGTSSVEGGADRLSFGELFRESLPFFWRSFWLWILVSLPFLVIVLLVMGLLFFGIFALVGNNFDEAGVLGLVAMIPVMLACFCVTGLLSWIVRLIAQQAQNAVVLEDLGTVPALSRGWEVFRQNLGTIIVMSIILGVIGFVVGLVFAIPAMMIAVPVAVAFMAGQGQSATPLILLGLCLVVFIPVALVLNGVLTSFQEAVWTLTYLRLTRKPQTDVVFSEANA